MPDLRFLNVRFNLDAPGERQIFDALIAYPAGMRSQVVRKALAAHLGIETTASESRKASAPAPKTKPSQPHSNAPHKTAVEDPLQHVESIEPTRVKPREISPESATGPAPIQDRNENSDEREAVRGLLSMLH